MLTSRFENIRMQEDETFSDFYSELSDIVNSCFYLGDKISDVKIVEKILRSLPERFHPKVTAIEETRDLEQIKLEELVGSLQTYKLKLKSPKKNKKNIALKSVNEEGLIVMSL